MTIALYFIIAIFLFAPSAAARQGGAITGRVVADDGEGVANVTVSLYAVGAQSGEERHRRPAAVRDTSDQALTARRAAMRAGHVGLRPGLVDEDQTFGIKPSLIAPPPGALTRDVGSLLLGGA